MQKKKYFFFYMYQSGFLGFVSTQKKCAVSQINNFNAENRENSGGKII